MLKKRTKTKKVVAEEKVIVSQIVEEKKYSENRYLTSTLILLKIISGNTLLIKNVNY